MNETDTKELFNRIKKVKDRIAILDNNEDNKKEKLGLLNELFQLLKELEKIDNFNPKHNYDIKKR